MFSVTLEDEASGIVATTELTVAPSVSGILGDHRRHGRPPVRLVRDIVYRALEESLLGALPGLAETTIEVGRRSFEVVLQNDCEQVIVRGEYGSHEVTVRHEVKPAPSADGPVGT